MSKTTIKVTVTLNGTSENPYHRYGLLRNPFPVISKYEAAAANEVLSDLEANPIKDVDDLRRRMTGCTSEFIELCCRNFKPGESVSFLVEFPSDWV